MIIADQIALFFLKVREVAGNSRLTDDEALIYINNSRRSVAIETKFYDVKDTITAEGGETYWTMRDDFLGLLEPVRDHVTCNGYAVTIKSLAEWATITAAAYFPTPAGYERWGMMNGNTFYIYPAAAKGDVMVWWGYAEPPALPDVTGPDVHLNNSQAELTVLDAAIKALEDLGERPGEILLGNYAKLKKIVSERAKPRGPRLENAPEG